MTLADFKEITRMLNKLKARFAGMVARAVVQVINDEAKMQLMQIGVQSGEDMDDAERVQNYGFTSVPKAGAEAVVVFPNGDRAHALVVAVDDRRYRPTGWQPGEVGIYTDEAGHKIHLLRGKITAVVADTIKLGSESANDPVIRKSDLDAFINGSFNTHVHTHTVGPGSTAAPTAPATPPAGSPKVKAD